MADIELKTGLETLKLNSHEYCQILEDGNVSQVKVIKLQPLMSCGKPKDYPYDLPYRICCNDSACEPIGRKKCITKNYMTIKSLSSADADVKEGQIKQVQIVNSDVHEIFFTGEG